MTEDKKFIRKPVLPIIAALLIIIAGAAVFLLLPVIHPAVPQAAVNQNCRVDQESRLIDPCVPLFRVITGTNDTIRYMHEEAESYSPDNPVPSPEECKIYAEKALESYGGMPGDAVLISVWNSSSGWWNGSISEINFNSAIRSVDYRQRPYGMMIAGSTGKMSIKVGGHGNISDIRKDWLSLEEKGLIRIIPASEAFQKLKNGEMKKIPYDALDLTIHDIKFGYYPPVNDSVPQYLEPVWIFNATDKIHGRSLAIYVSAEMNPEQHELYGEKLTGNSRNFSQIEGTVPQPDITPSSNILIGTSGPVGIERARESVRSFLNNPDNNLTYTGRFIEHNECGWVYYWVYYDFTAPGCELKVDSYTGSVLSADVNRSCTNVGIKKNLSEIANLPTENADMLIVNFSREHYSQFDKRNMTVKYRRLFNLNDDAIHYNLEGDSAIIILGFNRDDGLLRYYKVFNSNEATMCGGKPVRIGD